MTARNYCINLRQASAGHNSVYVDSIAYMLSPLGAATC